jgi:hypothetical protein
VRIAKASTINHVRKCGLSICELPFIHQLRGRVGLLAQMLAHAMLFSTSGAVAIRMLPDATGAHEWAGYHCDFALG